MFHRERVLDNESCPCARGYFLSPARFINISHSDTHYSTAPKNTQKTFPSRRTFFLKANPARALRRRFPDNAKYFPPGLSRTPCTFANIGAESHAPPGDGCDRESLGVPASFILPECFQFETRCVSNHTACRFSEKTQFFRSLWAGRRCAAPRVSPFSK